MSYELKVLHEEYQLKSDYLNSNENLWIEEVDTLYIRYKHSIYTPYTRHISKLFENSGKVFDYEFTYKY